jgi:signal transduction histidine kinase
MGEHDESLEQSARAVLRDDSDRLLRAVEELRALEREKRLQDVSSPPFHELARQVEEKAREVFRLAEQEERHGSVAAHDEPIEDPDPDDS